VEAALDGEEEGFSVFLLYGDHEGGQRTISRFGLRPHEEEGRWFSSVTRHWNLEGPDPRGDARHGDILGHAGGNCIRVRRHVGCGFSRRQPLSRA
jgi:hypothetical protein